MRSERSAGVVASIVGLVFFAFSGCGSGGQAASTPLGGAEVAVVALTASDVVSATVTITASDLANPIVVALVATGGTWGGTVGQIPAGPNRTFTLSARDAAGTEVYHGQVTGVTIAPGQPATVVLTAQQVSPPPPRNNAAPVIDALVASAATVAPGDVINLAVTAHDPNPGDTLSYAWSASANAGTFLAPTAPSTNWTAPATDGTIHITIDVRDQKNAHAKMSLDVLVVAGHGQGKASIAVSLNTWPVITDVTADPTRVDAGQTVVLNVVVADSDGDTLSYLWSSDCLGTFGSASVSSPTFTLTAVPTSKACTFAVTVQDGKGGTGTGSIAVAAGPAPVLDLPPTIVSTYQSAESVEAGGTVTLRVQAVDANGTAISFAWTTTQGSLGQPNTTAGASDIVWTAPTPFTANAEIQVAITDATGQTTVQVLAVTPTGPGPVAPYVADSNTVLLEHFDGSTTGSILAYSGSAACGNSPPAATPHYAYVAGPAGLGQALSLSPPVGAPPSSGSYVKFPGEVVSIPSGTIEFWLNVSGPGGGASQYPYPGACWGYTLGFGVNPNQTLTSTAWAGFDLLSTATVPLNEWFHVATTWGSAGAKLYLNGELVATDPRTGGPASGFGASLTLLHDPGQGSTAVFDELRISNIQRTAFNVP